MDVRHAQSQVTTQKPLVFAKMEGLVREMQDPETGVPIRSQKLFLTSIPSAFMGYDLIEWLMERLEIEDSGWRSAEAIHLANLLCQYGYFFPVGESRSLIVKDDSSLYRFQTPYYWPSQNHSADTTDYAIYLTKRLSRNKQKHGLEDYELEAYNKLKRVLAHKWDFITMQAEEQVKLAKDRKKGDKIVTDSQERAYWRVYRPPPGFTNCLETAPVPDKTNMANRVRKKTIDDLKKDNDFLATTILRTRQKVSQAAEALLTYSETYSEYDPFLTFPQPSNPWIAEDQQYWVLNDPQAEVPTEKRVRRWGIDLEELMHDFTGRIEFTNYLKKEYSHENIRFWQSVNDLRRGPASNVTDNVQNIFEEFLKPGAPCEINIDGKTMEQTQQLMKHPTRFTYDLAAEHVYILLLKKDCYPRFLRSEQYKTLLANAIQPSQKKRFFSFGGPGKKKISTASAPNSIPTSQTPQPLKRHGSDDQAVVAAGIIPHGSTGSITGDGGSSSVHQGGGVSSTISNKLDCDPPYSASERHNVVTEEESHCTAICPWEGKTESNTINICPWEASAPPAPRQQPKPVEQRLIHPKARPDRSKSVDVTSFTKRQGSVSAAPNLGPIPSECQPDTAFSPGEELSNRTTEKSKSIDVDVCPWEVNEPTKSTTSSWSSSGARGTSSSQSAAQSQGEYSEKPLKSPSGSVGSVSFKHRSSKEVGRPPCERKISIQVCPWEEVVEEEGLGAETQSISSVSDKTLTRQQSESIDNRLEQDTKSKEKYTSMNVMSSVCENPAKSDKVTIQVALEPRPRVGSEGTSSPSSTGSSSSYSDSRRIKIDYTVRSGHLPGQYGLPVISSPSVSAIAPVSQPLHSGHVSAIGISGSNTSSASSSTNSSSGVQQSSTKAESPRATGTLPCPPAEGSSRPSSPKIATNVVAPWEDPPPQKMTDICPWEDDSLTPTWL